MVTLKAQTTGTGSNNDENLKIVHKLEKYTRTLAF